MNIRALVGALSPSEGQELLAEVAFRAGPRRLLRALFDQLAEEFSDDIVLYWANAMREDADALDKLVEAGAAARSAAIAACDCACSVTQISGEPTNHTCGKPTGAK